MLIEHCPFLLCPTALSAMSCVCPTAFAPAAAIITIALFSNSKKNSESLLRSWKRDAALLLRCVREDVAASAVELPDAPRAGVLNGGTEPGRPDSMRLRMEWAQDFCHSEGSSAGGVLPTMVRTHKDLSETPTGYLGEPFELSKHSMGTQLKTRWGLPLSAMRRQGDARQDA